MLRFGTFFWPRGPQKLDWTVDLSDGTFGPLRLGSTVDEVKTALGRPDAPQFFGAPRLVSYEHFGLMICLDAAKRIYEFQLDIPERISADFGDFADPSAQSLPTPAPFCAPFEGELPQFNALIKLPGASSRPLRRLTLSDFERAFNGSGKYTNDGMECEREWLYRGHVVYVSLLDDQQTIGSVGWAVAED